MRAGYSDRRAIVAAAACVPLMNVLPSVSHDYKLVLLVFPLAVLVALLLAAGPAVRKWWAVLLGCVAYELVMLSRSTLLIVPSLLANKYPLIVLLQVLLVAVAFGVVRRDDPILGDVAAAVSP